MVDNALVLWQDRALHLEPAPRNAVEELELIVALIPATTGWRLAANMNRQLVEVWHPEDPVDLYGHEGTPNHVPHMTMFHMYMRASRFAEAMEIMNRLGHALGNDFRLVLHMKDVATFADNWVFWWPMTTRLGSNREWNKLRHHLLKGEAPLLSSLRSRDHDGHPDMAPSQREQLERHGYAFIDMPHVTVGYLADGATPPNNFPAAVNHRCHFNRLVLGRRGPRGTIIEVLYQVHLDRHK